LGTVLNVHVLENGRLFVEEFRKRGFDLRVYSSG